MQISPRILVAAATIVLAVVYATASSVHDDLPKYGLPPGLLPDSVVSYSVGSNGEFEVELASPCYVKFIDLAYYDSKIRGVLSYRSITNIEGIQVKKLFAWLPVTGIVADSGGKSLNFYVGFLTESVPTALFATIPHCRSKLSSNGSGAFIAEAALHISEV